MKTYQVTLEVEVHHEGDLKKAAETEALKIMSIEDWTDLRNSNLCVVSADLHMILDPGVSPPGTSIEHGEVIYISGDE